MKCQYGCLQEAKYQLKNGKWCCSDKFNKCPNTRLKNSNGVKRAYKNGNKKCTFTFEQRGWRKNTPSLDDKDIFTEKCHRSLCYIRSRFKQIKEYKCSCCNLTKWNNKTIVLEMYHINGERLDCRVENLRWLCPNCHSQTKTYKGGNRGKGKKVSDEEFCIALKEEKNIRSVNTIRFGPKGR